jgi:hypothetical protein
VAQKVAATSAVDPAGPAVASVVIAAVGSVAVPG